MHLKRDDDHQHGPPIIPITFKLEDPEGLTGTTKNEWQVMGGEGESLLEVAIDHGINIEHACGGVCACSTCHVYVESGMDQVTEATEAEEDRVEEAPAIQRNSRLSCQCELRKLAQTNGPIVVRVPAWNRNAVKEIPH
jgi:2Fe-2S ferredoxin